MENRSAHAGVTEAVDELDRMLAFGPFRLLPARRLLLEGEQQVTIGARAFDLLVALVRHPGEVVGKDDLFAQAWPGVTVEEGNLRVHINALRKTLGDGQDGRRYIVNNPGRGYSFVAPIRRLEGNTHDVERGTKPPTGNLPRATMPIVGRDPVIEAMVVQLPRRRFITITGTGGVGKTRVALAVADALRPSYRDGAYLIDLAPVAEAALVPTALSFALGLSVNSGSPIPDVLTVLRDKQMLVVLDSCEHVVDGAAALAQAIHQNAPEIHILATSRQALRATGEHVQRLPPLELPPASPRLTAVQALTFASVRLFAERASALLDTFEISDANAPTIALICRRLDGIALAIEFAAARVDALGVHGIADRLDDRFALLKQGTRTAPSRHRTLQATLAWSYELLPERARTVLLRLAVFAGSFTFASAVTVVADPEMDEADIADAFTELVSTSLIAADLRAIPATYRLLESTRAYAFQRLVESGERPRMSRRHAEHLLRDLIEGDVISSGGPRAASVQMHGDRLDNLRVALDWTFSETGDAQLGIDLTVAALPFWQRLSLTEECRSRAEIALARLGADEVARNRRELELRAALGDTLALRSGEESSAAWIRALALAESIDDRDYQLRALRGLWRNSFTTGNLRDAQVFARKFADVAETSETAASKRVSDYLAGMNSLYVGELTAAHLSLIRALPLSNSRCGNMDVLRFSIEHSVAASANLAIVLWLLGCPDEATQMAERSVSFANSAGHGLSLAYTLAWSACRIAIQIGDIPRAEHCLALLAEQASWDSLGQWDVICRGWTAVLRAHQGDFEVAADMLAATLQGVPEGNFRLHQTRFLGEQAFALSCLGKPVEAQEAIDRAINICNRRNERWFFPELLRFKGEIHLKAGYPGAEASAEKQFRAAITWAKRQGALSWELRAATSLARLKHVQGKAGEAHDILALIYVKFNEGFATKDLRVARALLNDIAGN